MFLLFLHFFLENSPFFVEKTVDLVLAKASISLLRTMSWTKVLLSGQTSSSNCWCTSSCFLGRFCRIYGPMASYGRGHEVLLLQLRWKISQWGDLHAICNGYSRALFGAIFLHGSGHMGHALGISWEMDRIQWVFKGFFGDAAGLWSSHYYYWDPMGSLNGPEKGDDHSPLAKGLKSRVSIHVYRMRPQFVS